MNEAAAAFARAASRSNPLFQTFHAYRTTLDDKGRAAMPLDWAFTAPGAVQWRSTNPLPAGIVGTFTTGEGMATLYTDWAGPLPDYLQDREGNWYEVKEGLERDGLGASLRLKVKRWNGEAPTIRSPAP
jgi:hypothetical protein